MTAKFRRPFVKLEDSLEDLVEGSVARIFRTTLQPAEISRRLIREMDERRMSTVAGTVVPNVFVVRVSPADRLEERIDLETLASIVTADLEHHIQRAGWATVGDLLVSIDEDPDMRQRHIGVDVGFDRTHIDEDADLEPADGTEPLDRLGGVLRRVPWVLQAISHPFTGISHWITTSEVSVGRALDNDWVIDHPVVSRRHAMLVIDENDLTIHDLQSLNGTFVNRRRVVSPLALAAGDIITFGTIDVLVDIDARFAPPVVSARHE